MDLITFLLQIFLEKICSSQKEYLPVFVFGRYVYVWVEDKNVLFLPNSFQYRQIISLAVDGEAKPQRYGIVKHVPTFPSRGEGVLMRYVHREFICNNVLLTTNCL